MRVRGARTVRSGGRGQGAGARYRVRGRCAVDGRDTGRERDIGCADGARWRGGSAISGARTVHGGGAGARYRVRGWCAVEGGDKGRERDIGCADGARWRAGTRGGSAISGARTVRGGGPGHGAGARYRVRGRCAVEGRERDIGCADGARWRAGTRGGSAISGAPSVEGRDKGRERDIGCADGVRWRAGTTGAISGVRTVRGGGRGQGAGARYRLRGRCAVEGGDKGRERDIGCADGARWRVGTRGGSAM